MANPIRWLGVALGVALLFGTAPAGANETKWQQNHPRRTEVNKRLNNQNARIQNGVQNGSLSKGQAQQLHKEDRTIRKEERADAARNGGHITKREQRQLNRQENQVSKQIHEEKHPVAP
jgi:hypothetical protein